MGVPLNILEPLVGSIKGCTFASLDAVTVPTPGVIKMSSGVQVILFSSKESGYERMVRRRLIEAGKEPNNFVLSDLPWGEKVDGGPLIRHNGKMYLQGIVLNPGQARWFVGTLNNRAGWKEIDGSKLAVSKRKTPNQGLGSRSVYVAAYNVENITNLRLLGETLRPTEGAGGGGDERH